MGWVYAAVAVAGAVVSAYGTYRSSQAAASSAEYNAQMARYEGEYAQKQAQFQEQQHRRNVARFIGEQRVAGARAGSTGAGSDVTPFLETAKQAEVEAALIRYGGSLDTWSSEAQRNLLKAQAGEYRVAGYLQGGGTILNTVGRYDFSKSYGSQGGGSSLLKSNKYRWAPRGASGL
jgi:hypothetical protein